MMFIGSKKAFPGPLCQALLSLRTGESAEIPRLYSTVWYHCRPVHTLKDRTPVIGFTLASHLQAIRPTRLATQDIPVQATLV